MAEEAGVQEKDVEAPPIRPTPMPRSVPPGPPPGGVTAPVQQQGTATAAGGARAAPAGGPPSLGKVGIHTDKVGRAAKASVGTVLAVGRRGWEIFWRCLQLATAIIAFSVMASASHNGLLFSDFLAYRFLVATTVITGAWALGRLLYNISLLISASGRRCTLLTLEFIMTWFVLAGGAAAAALITFADRGTGVLAGYCQGSFIFSTYCVRTRTAATFAIITFFLFLPTLWIFTRAAVRRH